MYLVLANDRKNDINMHCLLQVSLVNGGWVRVPLVKNLYQ